MTTSDNLKPLSDKAEAPVTLPRRASGFRRFFRTLTVIIVLSLIPIVYFKFFYVFGDGVKSGHLNFAVRKGNVFKTWEGKLIQEGFKGNMQSNEFEFSIKTKAIYDILSVNSGKVFDLHYKEYNGVVPWRGNTRYLVDSIISMRN